MGPRSVPSLTPGPGSGKAQYWAPFLPWQGEVSAEREESEGGSESTWEGVVTEAKVGGAWQDRSAASGQEQVPGGDSWMCLLGARPILGGSGRVEGWGWPPRRRGVRGMLLAHPIFLTLTQPLPQSPSPEKIPLCPPCQVPPTVPAPL